MNNYDNAIKLLEKHCGNDKEVILGLATIALSANTTDQPRPAVRMMCAYYEDGAFYMSTDARKDKTIQIEKNNEVSVCGMDWFAFHGIADNLGWVKDEKNAKIRAKFKKVFDWFDEVGGEDDPNSIILCVTLTEGTMFDVENNHQRYVIDFVNKTAK